MRQEVTYSYISRNNKGRNQFWDILYCIPVQFSPFPVKPFWQTQ